jgi:hypothetical protein
MLVPKNLLIIELIIYKIFYSYLINLIPYSLYTIKEYLFI